MARFVIRVDLAESHEFIEHAEIHILKSLAFEQAPVLIATFEQIALVKVNRLGEQGRAAFLELIPRHSFRRVEGMLEDCNVKPQVRLQIELHPIVLNHQHLWPIMVVECGLKMPQGLS